LPETEFAPEAVRRATEFRIAADEAGAAVRLAARLRELVGPDPAEARRPTVVFCIGTDRSTGDCLGPLVGSLLEERRPPGLFIHGTLAEPVHAANLTEVLGLVRSRYPRPRVLAVDACLGALDSVGKITLGPGAIRPGAGVNKHLPPVGDLHITGVVNVGGFMEYFVLQNTRLHLVVRLARVIADGLTLHAEQLYALAGLSASGEAAPAGGCRAGR